MIQNIRGIGWTAVGFTVVGAMLVVSPARADSQAPSGSRAPEADTGNSVKQESESSQGPQLAPNSVYAEGLGAGLAYSINYERMVLDDLGVRAGLSYLSVGASASTSAGTASSSATFVSVPITASYLGVRGGKHALELGGGATLMFASASGSAMGLNASASGFAPLGTAMAGYRLHPLERAGFQFRIGAMALVAKGLNVSAESPDSVGVLPWGYLSMGASF